MQITFLPAFILMVAMSARSELVFKPIDYKQADAVLEGLSVYDDAIHGN